MDEDLFESEILSALFQDEDEGVNNNSSNTNDPNSLLSDMPLYASAASSPAPGLDIGIKAGGSMMLDGSMSITSTIGSSDLTAADANQMITNKNSSSNTTTANDDDSNSTGNSRKRKANWLASTEQVAGPQIKQLGLTLESMPEAFGSSQLGEAARASLLESRNQSEQQTLQLPVMESVQPHALLQLHEQQVNKSQPMMPQQPQVETQATQQQQIWPQLQQQQHPQGQQQQNNQLQQQTLFQLLQLQQQNQQSSSDQQQQQSQTLQAHLQQQLLPNPSSAALPQLPMDLSWILPIPSDQNKNMAVNANLNSSSALENERNNRVRSILSTTSIDANTGTSTSLKPSPFRVNPQEVLKQFVSVTAANSEPSILHRSLKIFPNSLEIVKHAIGVDPSQLRRKSPLPASERKKFVVQECLGYPLNIALQHNASLEVLQVLVQVAPEVITCRDGRDECGSLSIVLRKDPNNVAVLHLLIKANPLCLRMTDRRHNTPLHVAIGRGASLQVIRALYLLHPPSIIKTNLNGETPFDIAQRNTRLCGDEVVNFVQEAYHGELLRMAEQKHNSSSL